MPFFTSIFPTSIAVVIHDLHIARPLPGSQRKQMRHCVLIRMLQLSDAVAPQTLPVGCLQRREIADRLCVRQQGQAARRPVGETLRTPQPDTPQEAASCSDP